MIPYQFLFLHEMTKITNIHQYHKSYRKYNSENGRTLTVDTALHKILLIKNPKLPSNLNFPCHYLPFSSEELNSDMNISEVGSGAMEE
jgi:hypothetical protein